MVGQENRPAGRKPGMRKKWRHSRAILKEGLEAALRSDPEIIDNCKPKTYFGRLIQGMVLEAAKCKATPLKTVMGLLDWKPDDWNEDDQATDDGPWDWNADGEWETKPEPEPARPAGPKGDTPEEAAARTEFKRRINRLIEAGQHEHAARIVNELRSRYADELRPHPSG